MNPKNQIFQRFLNGTCSEEELNVLLRFFEETEDSQVSSLIDSFLTKNEDDKVLPENMQNILDRNRQVLQKKVKEIQREKSIVRKWAVVASIAATVLLLCVLGVLYFSGPDQSKSRLISQSLVHDIAPGSNRATLTLQNGKSIDLKDDPSGIRLTDNKISYQDGEEIFASTEELQSFRVSTAKGGQYQVMLADGTKVWLNSISALEYPSQFKGRERIVKLQGEAYFEVKHRPNQPFIVQTASQSVRVLGTMFNVSAYVDDTYATTTLLSGKVELKSLEKGEVRSLEPDEQAVLTNSGYQVNHVDAHFFTAWKDGEFRFKATPLPMVLKQLDRWYGLDIDYTHVPEDIKVHAVIRRDKKLSSVLYALESVTGLKFERKGRRIRLME